MGALLTVVVPIYNVGGYLAECLDSLAAQTYTDLDVVLVDDGSTDDSGEIAARYPRADGRFRLLSQVNRGLGAARNAGIDLATGDFLTFVDSDDVLPPYALETLVRSLELTGSDFATGNVALLTSRGLRQSPLHRGTHRETRLRTRLSSQRNLVYDRLACNKVFRRGFWERHELRFPEGVRYEDIPVTIPAYAMAESVDVLDVPTYHWRQREAGMDMSLSQRQTEVTNLVDRFAAVDSASRSLAALGETKLKDWYDETALQSDLRMFLHLLPDVDDAYRERFLDLAGDFLSRVDPKVLDRLAPSLRVAWRLVRLRRLSELLAVVSATRDGAVPPVVKRGRQYFQQIPYLDAGLPDLPRSLYQVRGGMRAQVHEVRWQGGKLRLQGHAYDAAAGAPRPWSSIRGLWLRDYRQAQKRVLLPTVPRRSPDAPVGGSSHAWSGFRVSIDPGALRGPNGWVEDDWTVRVASLGPTGLDQREMGVGDIRPPMPAAWVAPDVRILPVLRKGMLWLRVERPKARVTGCRIDGDDLVLLGRVATDLPGPASVRLCRAAGVAWRSYPVRTDDPTAPGTVPAGVEERPTSGFAVRIPLVELAGDAAGQSGFPTLPGQVSDDWLVELVTGDESTATPLPVSADFADLHHPVGHRAVLVEPGDGGSLWIRSVPAGPLLTGVREEGGDLVLTGVSIGRDEPEAGFGLVLRFRDEGPTLCPPADLPVPVHTAGDRWQAVLRSGRGAGLPVAGYWWLLHRPGDAEDGTGASADLPCAFRVREELAAKWTGGRLRIEPDRHRRVVLHVAL